MQELLNDVFEREDSPLYRNFNVAIKEIATILDLPKAGLQQREYVESNKPLSLEADSRLAALSSYLTCALLAKAANHPFVLGFRDRHLPEGLLPLNRAAKWLQDQRIGVRSELSQIAERLAPGFRLDDHSFAGFVITGIPQKIEAITIGRTLDEMRRPFWTITVDALTTPNELAAVYRNFRDAFQDDPPIEDLPLCVFPGMQPKSLYLAAFDAWDPKRDGETWRDRARRWNEMVESSRSLPSKWAYRHKKKKGEITWQQFRRDTVQARHNAQLWHGITQEQEGELMDGTKTGDQIRREVTGGTKRRGKK